MSSGPKFVTRVHMAPDGYRHEHIDEIEYHHGFDSQPQYATISVMALLIDEHGWEVRVTGAPEHVRLQTVQPYGRPPYVRAFADTVPTNDLLDVPRY
jgi:hypothetical protein